MDDGALSDMLRAAMLSSLSSFLYRHAATRRYFAARRLTPLLRTHGRAAHDYRSCFSSDVAAANIASRGEMSPFDDARR